MLTASGKNEEALAAAILLSYSIPVGAYGFYAMSLTGHKIGWSIFSLGLLLLISGSIFLFLWLRKKSNSLDSHKFEPVYAAELAQNGEQSSAPEENFLEREILQLRNEKEALNKNIKDINLEKEQYYQITEELKEKLSSQTIETSQTIESLRDALDHKQQQNQHLENQIHDLRYEIKTLLQLAEVDYSRKEPLPDVGEQSQSNPDERELFEEHFVSNDEEAKILLKHCVDMAQKMTGAFQLKSPARPKSVPVDHYTLDLRLLFDALRAENGALIGVYSLKENKMIFANNQIKPLFGYSPEKFVQDFPSIIEDSLNEWNAALNQLLTKSSASTKLSIKSKSGIEVLTSCHIGSIPTGIFRGLAIFVAYI